MAFYFDEIEKKKEQLKRLKQCLYQHCRHPIGGYKLEDIMSAIRKAGVAEDYDRERFFIVFDTHADDSLSSYNDYKCIYPILWYFHLILDDQPAPTINFLYRLFFAEELLLKTPKNNLKRWEQ